jgi:hypothetical protein
MDDVTIYETVSSPARWLLILAGLLYVIWCLTPLVKAAGRRKTAERTS